MRSPERAPVNAYDEDARSALHEIARASIEHGLQAGVALEPDPTDYAESLRAERACFVTLRKKSSRELRGCIGGLEARLHLVLAVSRNAFSAAFRDPRFPALSRAEFADTDIHLSVLSPLQAVQMGSERELCECLRPGVDGLVLADAGQAATFLPDVWENLTDPRRFVQELKKKAGMSPDHWSPSMRIQLYTTESF